MQLERVPKSFTLKTKWGNQLSHQSHVFHLYSDSNVLFWILTKANKIKGKNSAERCLAVSSCLVIERDLGRILFKFACLNVPSLWLHVSRHKCCKSNSKNLHLGLWRIISVQKITLERIPHMADSVPDVWFAHKDIKNHKLEQICSLGLMPAVDTTSY